MNNSSPYKNHRNYSTPHFPYIMVSAKLKNNHFRRADVITDENEQSHIRLFLK